MTARAARVKMVALVSTASTPTSVFVATDGKEHIVKQVSYPFLRELLENLRKEWLALSLSLSWPVPVPHKPRSKGYRGQGVLFFFSTKSEAFVSELNPSYRAGPGVEPGSAAPLWMRFLRTPQQWCTPFREWCICRYLFCQAPEPRRRARSTPTPDWQVYVIGLFTSCLLKRDNKVRVS